MKREWEAMGRVMLFNNLKEKALLTLSNIAFVFTSYTNIRLWKILRYEKRSRTKQ